VNGFNEFDGIRAYELHLSISLKGTGKVLKLHLSISLKGTGKVLKLH
jgi:hypothetical protein